MDHISKFRKEFKLDAKLDLRNIATAVNSIYEAQEIAWEYLSNIDNPTEAQGFKAHCHINLVGRIYEHAQAMLVAIATGSYTSGEALARIVVEGSVNLMHMNLKGDERRLISFFSTWITEHQKKLRDWKGKMQNTPHSLRVGKMIDTRLNLIDDYARFVEAIAAQCEIDLKSGSEKNLSDMRQKFVAVARETDYYEIYHRLSGSSHITGEDTLTWLIALNCDDKTKHQLGNEATCYSVMMSRFASMYFVDAVTSCVIAHGRIVNEDLARCRGNLVSAIGEIARDAGAPVVQ